MEKVRERLRRVTTALNDARIPYAVIGGNAVKLWVAQVDETWLERYSPELRLRLKELPDHPDA